MNKKENLNLTSVVIGIIIGFAGYYLIQNHLPEKDTKNKKLDINSKLGKINNILSKTIINDQNS